MLYFISILPPLLFILILMWLDSFSLVRKNILMWSFLMGMIAVPLCYIIIKMFTDDSTEEMAAPVIEEMLKGLGILLLVKMRRCAFFIDAALYGAAIGAGFSFIENIVYIFYNSDMMIGTAIVRGIGTAIMHCGCVISTAVIISWLANRKKETILYFIPAMIPAALLHTIYNSLTLPPMLLLLATIFAVSIWTVILFVYNEKSIGKWMEKELFAEVSMLAALKQGKFSDSKAGQYMISVKEQFAPECFFDMLCYVRLYYELSLICKANMIKAEAGFPIIKDKDTSDKVIEFNTLKKRIGKTAQFTLSPIVKPNRLTDWKIESLI